MTSAGGFRRRVALKLLNGSWDPESDAGRRLRDEARLPGRLQHRHIVRVDDLLQLGGRWALLMADYSLYIPANLLPMMVTTSPQGTANDTIMSGVVYLLSSGSWPLALLVFLASITIPLAKLVSLTFLAWSVQRRSTWQPEQRARIYRMVEIVGRWSMLDVYIVTIMAALVQMQPLAAIDAGPAAIAFGAVGVLGLLAANSFDPRLIWDPLGDHDD